MGKPRVRLSQAVLDGLNTQEVLPDQVKGPETMPTTMQSQFVKLLAAVVNTKTALQQDIGAISMGLGLLHAEHRKLSERVQETECDIADIHPAQEVLKHQVAALSDPVRRLEYSAEDAEGCKRCNNVCVVGLLEEVEGKVTVSSELAQDRSGPK
ncbi:hypothetical protein NDU88_005704 [Pleurodeles waltl]|uniref:Uncharacterized protein n=1 Tax=Pleurodeles waltl TaxID=8319 RepID=A0AAV7NRB7_PLEWA|nr:hypothetical protein NDU88_005704 [Pleurodeles waltl]